MPEVAAEEQRQNSVDGANRSPLAAYQFKPGQSGNPRGRPKGKSLTSLLRGALDKVADEQTGRTVADLVVEALIDLARSGDRRAIMLVFDRVDGKTTEAADDDDSERRVDIPGFDADGNPDETTFAAFALDRATIAMGDRGPAA